MEQIFFTTAKPALVKLLQQHGLQAFSDWWSYAVSWFEAPNQRRGGWSGVGRICLSDAGRSDAVLFVKKQENHGRRSWRHPWSGEPTFRREFQRLQQLAAANFVAPSVVMYAETCSLGQQRAVLVTEALTGFIDLETFLPALQALPRQVKRQTLAKIASEIRRFHDMGLVHRALYPKHIFVSGQGAASVVALIDLEKARKSLCGWQRAQFDLSALQRHTAALSATDRLYFFKHYLGKSPLLTQRLNAGERRLLSRILKRSQR